MISFYVAVKPSQYIPSLTLSFPILLYVLFVKKTCILRLEVINVSEQEKIRLTSLSSKAG